MIACSKVGCLADLEDEYVLMKVQHSQYILSGDIGNLDVNCDNYAMVDTLDISRIQSLQRILQNSTYHSDRDFASCPVDLCIVKVVEGKVVDRIFIGCGGDMLYRIGDAAPISIGLNDEGISALKEVIQRKNAN